MHVLSVSDERSGVMDDNLADNALDVALRSRAITINTDSELFLLESKILSLARIMHIALDIF
jgi:hypothetical protein